jgi:hypothetical protein
MERTKQGWIHFHALLDVEASDIPGNWLDFAWQGLSERQNGYARIRPYDPRLGGVGYLGKYVSKGGDLDIFVRPSLHKESSNRSPHSLLISTSF